MAVFQRVGNLPVVKEKLISLAILGTTAGAAMRTRRAPILSIPAALRGLIFIIILLTCALVMAGIENETSSSFLDLIKFFNFDKSDGMCRRPSCNLSAIVEK